MRIHAYIAALAVSVMALGASQVASAEEAGMDKDEKAPIEGYTDTGETRNCLPTYRIRNTRVLDNKTILFRMDGRDYYVNRLPRNCPGLKIEGGFGYTLRGLNDLCHTDSITVLSDIGGGATCMLGKFDRVEKTPKE